MNNSIKRWKKIKSIGINFIEGISCLKLVAFFFLTIIVFAIAYKFLTPCNQGLISFHDTVNSASIGNAIYFSIITIASLGYGDFTPIGFSKFLSCLEVLFGLAFMGILISKITSRKLSYHVMSLFNALAETRLEAFSEKFDNINKSLILLLRELAIIYQTTPDSPVKNQKNPTLHIDKIRDVLNEIKTESSRLERYFKNESEEIDFFSDEKAPEEAVIKLGDCVRESIHTLGQLTLIIPPVEKTNIFDVTTSHAVTSIEDSMRSICNNVIEKSKNNRIIESYNLSLVSG